MTAELFSYLLITLLFLFGAALSWHARNPLIFLASTLAVITLMAGCILYRLDMFTPLIEYLFLMALICCGVFIAAVAKHRSAKAALSDIN